MTDLKNGVHDARERPVVRMLCHLEDVQSPFVDVLEVLSEGTDVTRFNQQ